MGSGQVCAVGLDGAKGARSASATTGSVAAAAHLSVSSPIILSREALRMGASLGACCLQRRGRVGRELSAGDGTRRVLAVARQYKRALPSIAEMGVQVAM